jgi:hypothetical protein
MATVFGILQAVGVFLVGLAARLGVVVLVMALLASPALLWLAGVWAWRTVRPRVQGLRRAGHTLYRPGPRYAAGHTWLAREDGALRVGIDGVAQDLLPWALGVELPAPGTRLHEGDVAAVISCGGQEARVAAPVSGRIVKVNAERSLAREGGRLRPRLALRHRAHRRALVHAARRRAGPHLARPRVGAPRPLPGGPARLRRAAAPQLPQRDWDELTRSFLHA